MKEVNFNSLLEEDLKKKNKKLEKMKDKEGKKLFEKVFDTNIFLNIRKKIRKNFFIGFGFGLMIASIAFWIFSDNKVIKSSNDLTEKYTDAKIIEKAKTLGMIFPEEIIGEEVSND